MRIRVPRKDSAAADRLLPWLLPSQRFISTSLTRRVNFVTKKRVSKRSKSSSSSTAKKLGSSGKHILLSKIKDISQIPHLSEQEEKEDVVLSDDDESLDEKVDKDEEDAVEESSTCGVA